MKYLHRAKALEAYSNAETLLKKGSSYGSYIMLKESTRGTIAYVNSDVHDINYSEKTKLSTLIENATFIDTEQREVLNYLVKLEKSGLSGILSADIVELKKVKKVLKKIINIYIPEE